MRSLNRTEPRSRYFNCLQLLGILCVVAFHVGTPFSQANWIAVELFFVMAGVNMAPAFKREQTMVSYTRSRIIRLLPELLSVWAVVLLIVATANGSEGMFWFTVSAPLFLHNLSLPLFTYHFPEDWMFTSLWFVGALLQLQVLLFSLKRFLLRFKVRHIVLTIVGIGLLLRLAFGLLVAGNGDELSDRVANMLYATPISHLEAITLGLLIGLGGLSWLGRCLPVISALTLVLGFLNAWLSDYALNYRSFGFEFPLRLNYSHVWGYTILAFLCASLCTHNNILAVALEESKCPAWLDNWLTRMASLTYGVYVFHGLIMATGLNASALLHRPHAPGLRLALFAITVAGSFLLAWMFARAMQVARRAGQNLFQKRKVYNSKREVSSDGPCVTDR